MSNWVVNTISKKKKQKNRRKRKKVVCMFDCQDTIISLHTKWLIGAIGEKRQGLDSLIHWIQYLLRFFFFFNRDSKNRHIWYGWKKSMTLVKNVGGYTWCNVAGVAFTFSFIYHSCHLYWQPFHFHYMYVIDVLSNWARIYGFSELAGGFE